MFHAAYLNKENHYFHVCLLADTSEHLETNEQLWTIRQIHR